MKNPTTLFRLIELTRSQPQYGYILAEIPKAQLSDLAQHHYLVTFIAWQLAAAANRAGGEINTEKVLEYALVHDLGELFGGDIAMPYAQANPPAREAAKSFERENQKYISRFFEDGQAEVQTLFTEVMQATTNEALIAKIADYVEVTQYKLYVGRLTAGDIKMARTKIEGNINKLTDAKAQKALKAFVRTWEKELGNGKLPELFEKSK